MSIIYFQKNDEAFYVSEWGHTKLLTSRVVGPYRFMDYLLHFNLKGTTQYIGETALEGQAFFIPKNTKYTFTTSDEYDHYWFAFSGSRAQSFLKYFGIDPDKGSIIDVGNSEFYSSYSEAAFLKCSETNSEEIAMSALFSLLSLCKKTVSRTKKAPDIEFAAEIMENNYYKDLRIEDIASAVQLEKKYFARKFRNHFGVPPLDYLTDIRIKKSCELLRNGDCMIKETAFLCGYNSSLAFNVAFKRKMGMSPLQYRESKKITDNKDHVK